MLFDGKFWLILEILQTHQIGANMHTNMTFEPMRQRKSIMTRHAKKRGAQRGINHQQVELIRAFGARSHDGIGGVRCLMTRDVVERLATAFGHTQKLDSLIGTYIVVSAEDDAVVITAGHLHH